MNLAELAEAARSEQLKLLNAYTILLYGDSKTGKTRLAATIAKVPWIKKVYWWDLEHGAATLVTMVKEGVLTTEQAAKIILSQIHDTPDTPRAFETVSKGITSKIPGTICDIHGKWNCDSCVKGNKSSVPFLFSGLKEDEFLVIDTGSQLSDSIMNYYCLGKSMDYKPGWDEFGPQGRILRDILETIQGGGKNVIMVTHTTLIEISTGDDKEQRIYPSIGTKPFSIKCSKYFSHVCYMEIRIKETVGGDLRSVHAAGSSTLFRPGVITGSRAGWKIENEKEADFSLLFAKLEGEKQIPKQESGKLTTVVTDGKLVPQTGEQK